MSLKTKPSFIIRKLELNDCEEVLDILAEVEFVVEKYRNEILMNIDSDAILVAEDIETGKLLGLCSGFNLSPNFAFISQFAVRTQYQGLGIGSALWEQVMEHVGNDRNQSLYATNRMFGYYRDKCGFGIIPDKKLQLFEGIANCDLLVKQLDGVLLSPINEDNLQSVINYDKQVCDGFDRSVFLRGFSKSPETIALVAINEKSNEVIGYCIITATNFDKAFVKPLYADSETIAELLIGKCCELFSITTTIGLLYQCWSSNEKAINIANKMGLEFIIQEPILFTKKLIEGNLEKIYCVSVKGCYPF